ncbi:TspO/MBR family protein [Streptomyces bacillaris]|uniref:Tryptophan-rich sensory protein n=1 Tax=Streptomyces cavourensis TaxID=67258 RepID=A0AAD0QAM5_9ACTN|nr:MULTISPECIES: TspO/MBR family protein [Streptomyces]NUW18720.1 tryptophan-rich sensory protein [Streptomyces roseoviolaceus]AXI75478.1 tryptophan-rich sensory protein [Streptomyces cavourensis]MBH0244351.1 tryptophan-rich sensory protein [Streptomyces cavourensis]NUV38843.1 tryptophan-rich sensory protein [Streptomyces sp. CAI-24]NUV81031.1 tryptophan-rich sensory protein [Streptomyces sp. CAI-155]
MPSTPSTSTAGAAPARSRSWPVLLLMLVLCYAVAGVGAAASGDAGGTYAALDKPAWAPPGWLFGPVWTVLYGTIAVAGWLVARRPGPGRRPALVAWGVQLALNALWTPLFFAAEQYGAAFLDITLLLAAVVTTALLAARVDRRAALLLVPYLLWIGYAAALNLSLWLNN